MYGIEPILQHVIPLALVILRFAGLFAFTPVLANRGVPRRFRLMIGVMIGVAVYPALPAGAQIAPDVDVWGLLPLVAGEFLLGLIMGLIAALPILLLDLAGYFMGHQMGLSLSRIFNPESNSDTDTLGQVLMLLATGVFLSLGGLEVTLESLIRTFGRVPAGGIGAGQVPIDVIVGGLASGVELAIRVSSPVTGIIFLLMVALGLISKTLPQLNVMSIGFTMKILAGLALLMLAVGSIQQASGDRIEQSLRDVSRWASSLGPARVEHR